MVAFPSLQRLTLSPAVLAAAVTAGAAAAAMMALPTAALEAFVLDSGLAAFVPNAAPPLGLTARLTLVVLAGAVAGSAAWSIATLLPLPRPRRKSAADVIASVPVLRRADAHPDAPPRAPLVASLELGTPFLEVAAEPRQSKKIKAEPAVPAPAPIERDLPRDLDAPLAAFDPASIPDEPATPVPPVKPLYREPETVEEARIESFELPRPAPLPLDEQPIATARTDATIHALLERLEQGVARRNAAAHAVPIAANESRIDDALSELRRLATR